MRHADTRPRAKYLLADGTVIRVILDHGQEPAATIDYQIDGRITVGLYRGMAVS